MDADDSQVLKKVYFIKKPREGEEHVTLLKNKFKTIDAIRDLLGWFHDGRDFVVDLVGWDDEEDDDQNHLRFEISRFTTPVDNNRSVVGAIDQILSWLDDEKPFDISLIPRQSYEPGPGAISFN